ncbi:peptide MFS transporter [Levilactobacillus bambusae]|uniref:Di-/tripeptide transporter n=1 Tax=Levilactobacillus bambusae TaxID=2024736 RepID=A0A2V1N216_9LACO|nr:oligopeptide:H+ symporter [Levilactobacillus bambusae]PWG00356.1 peptide ABC transporter permease [Levilactobacillus bambusae]
MEEQANESDIKTQPKPARTFFGQPVALKTLFMTEFWERFSYYGMRAILLYYMYDATVRGGLGMSVQLATSIMAIYGALVFMTSVIGGFISDRLIGSARSVLYGGLLIMFGHILLSMPFKIAGLYGSILLITLGTGLLKPNVSETVGALYAPDDPRRDSAYSIFVMGINLGSLMAPLLVSWVGQSYNYHAGFSLAALGMALGLVGYIRKMKSLPAASQVAPDPLPKALRQRYLKRTGWGLVGLGLVLGGFALTHHLTANGIVLGLTILGVCLPIYYFIVMLTSPKVSAVERRHLKAYIPLFICEVLFCLILEQGGVVLALFAQDQTQLQVGSWHLQAGQFQSLNPLFIILYSPIFAWLWTKLGTKQPTAATKFAWSLIFSGLSFLIMAIPVLMVGTARVSPLWLVASWAILEIGELLLSPIGLSVTSTLAPTAYKSQMMSMWFLGNAAAQALNSQIVRFYTPQNEVAYFTIIGGITIVAAIIMFALVPAINRQMQDA